LLHPDGRCGLHEGSRQEDAEPSRTADPPFTVPYLANSFDVAVVAAERHHALEILDLYLASET